MKRTQLRNKAQDLTRRVLNNPDDVELERKLTEVEEDIDTLERAEAKLSAEAAESLEQSRARSRAEDAELDKIKPGDGYDAGKAFMDAEARAKHRVVGGQPSNIDFGSGYTQSYAMKRAPPPKIGDALQAIGGITEESVFGAELAPIREKLKPTFAPDVPELQQIRDALEIQEENLLEERLFNSGKQLHADGVAIRVEMQSIRPVEKRWLGDPMERELYRAAKIAVDDGGGLPPETLLEKSERMMREMGLDIEYTGEHQSAEALETAYNKLVVESDKLGAPEERAVFEEAERGALKDIEVDRSYYRSPAVEARIAHDTELAMKGLRESTSKSSGFGFEPQKSTVKTYTDDMGVKINSDFRPPQYDLFMEGGAEIEMQTIPSKLGGPWLSPHNVETTPYKWLSPSEIQMQALADEADEHFESLVSDDEIDGKIDTIEAEQQAIAKKAVEARGARSGDPAMLPEARTELTRTRVQLPGGDYHELADGALTRVETDWLARYDRMRSQDARSLKVDADLRALEVRRRALLHREHAREVSQVQLDDEFLNDGVRLGSREIAQETMSEQLERLTPAQRESLAMELGEGRRGGGDDDRRDHAAVRQGARRERCGDGRADGAGLRAAEEGERGLERGDERCRGRRAGDGRRPGLRGGPGHDGAGEGDDNAGSPAQVQPGERPGPREQLRVRAGRGALVPRVRQAAREVGRGCRRARERHRPYLRYTHDAHGAAEQQDRAALPAAARRAARDGLGQGP